ncbi:autotransporter-associated beta strand repeat-containing protein [Streptomyces sp. NPDC102270]|uniref:autotransporter-associated beta strand repeat-containing protein n=1 Tax=Streptomyces sp. NPDC102270 TaxID=3366150 RepID=UPI003808AD0F
MRLAAAALLALSGTVLLPARPAEAAGARDVTAAVLAGTDVTLSGPSIIRLPSGTTTYNGIFSGQGTLTIAGPGTLVITRDSAFTLPSSDQHQSLTRGSGTASYPAVSHPDQPAVIIDRGATLQYGNGGSTGVIGDYPYASIGGVKLNHDNIKVDGTLVLDLTNRRYNLGTITGSGLISQPRFTWNQLDLVGTIPFTGTIANGTGMNFGNVTYRLSMPSVSTVRNDGSAIIAARNYTLVLPTNFYEDHYGSDINFHTWQTGLIVMTGVDHYTNPSLDRTKMAHGSNYRGINIGAAHVQWGNGTTDKFFLPAIPSNSYINMRHGSLTFDYNGPVTLGTPISGGVLGNSPNTPGNASITLAATKGNAVTFAAPMNYHGTTTIGHGATLLLGTGKPGGDSSLLTGASNDAVMNDGTLTIRNAATAITLANVSGTGGLTQSGAATTTLSGRTRYTGPTTIGSGTLAVGSGGSGIASSSSLSLRAPGARFSIASARFGQAQSVRQLSGVAGSAIELGSTALTIRTSGSTTYAGSITGTSGGLTTSGSGTLTLTGHASTPSGTWRVRQGTLAIGSSGTLDLGSLIQSAGSTLSLTPGTGATSPTGAPIQVRGAVQLAGKLTLASVPAIPADGKVVLIHDTGTQPISGRFTGLPQGAHLTVDGKQFTIDYAAHDVTLRAGTGSSAAASGNGSASGDEASVSGDGGQSSGVGSPVALLGGAAAVAALAAGGVLVARRRRRTAARKAQTLPFEDRGPATPPRPARHRHRR